jgi:membrane-associated protease RseP (regulator of RpoE activity)
VSSDQYVHTWTDPGGVPTGVVPSPPLYRPRWWLHGLLLALTLVTTTFWGAGYSDRLPQELANLPPWLLLLDSTFILEGLKFSIPLLTILTCHEMGHYLACRAHGLVATPPFFIPFPLPIGTLGAVIRIKQAIRTRSQLMDVGAAGPVAGFLALLPFLAVGVALSEVRQVAEAPPGGVFELGEPLVYRAAERLFHPGLPADTTVFLHPTAAAAWFGVLITLLNLLPFAQLDGGHVCYALFGRWHRRVALPLVALLVVGGFFWYGWWLWAAIVLAMRVHHPPVADEEAPLDPRRRAIGWLALLIFVLCFMLDPIRLSP